MLHGNHWSSLLDGSRALTAMASVYDGKFDMKSCNGFFVTTCHYSTKLSRALCIQKRMQMILHHLIIIQFWILLMIYTVKVRQLRVVRFVEILYFRRSLRRNNSDDRKRASDRKRPHQKDLQSRSLSSSLYTYNHIALRASEGNVSCRYIGYRSLLQLASVITQSCRDSGV